MSESPEKSDRHLNQLYQDIFDRGLTDVSYSTELITPAMSHKYLATMVKNRKPVHGAIRTYVHAIRNGQWDLSGEPIVFDNEDRLVDGQHRLLAVIQSGIAAPFTVVRGVSPTVFDILDGGTQRSLAQTFAMNFVKNYKTVASVVRTAVVYSRSCGRTINYADKVTNREGNLYLEEDFESVLDSVAWGEKAYRECVGTPGGAAFGHYVLSRINRDAADFFMEKICSGTNLPKGSPILSYRKNYFRCAKNSNTSIHRNQQVDMLFRAWNRWLKKRNTAVTSLTFPYGLLSSVNVIVPAPGIADDVAARFRENIINELVESTADVVTVGASL